LIAKIVSGGQTGADRAALDVAIGLGIATGGWVPRGRRAEDGAVPGRYVGMDETESPDYAERTRLNVRDSDATLILAFGRPSDKKHTGQRFIFCSSDLANRFQLRLAAPGTRKHCVSGICKQGNLACAASANR
jgi:hypothetical protein